MDNGKPGNPGPRSLALRADALGITAYMTRPAIEELIRQLRIICDTDPGELRDVHVAMHFSGWDEEGNYVPPSFGHHDGLGPILRNVRNGTFADEVTDRDRAQGVTPDMMYRAFDITIMHVSADIVEKVVTENDKIAGDLG